MQIFLFFALFIAILAIVFAIQNNAQTSVSFFIWRADGSLALVLLIAMAIGALISYLVSLPSIVKSRLAVRNLRKKTEELEAEIHKYQVQLEEIQKVEPEPEHVEVLPEPEINNESNPL